MHERILLALDSSKLAEQALPHAVAQADRFGAELVLLRVLEPFPRAGILWQEDVNRAEKQAIDQAQQLLLAALRLRRVYTRKVVLEIAHQVLDPSGVDVLAPRAHHSEALHELGAILGGEFVPVPLARVSDEAAHLGVVLRAACPGEGGP
jgi:nucleotide-binding universal stress UspA family protein